jgi:DNA-binding NarL/FixJ family response regulator
MAVENTYNPSRYVENTSHVQNSDSVNGSALIGVEVPLILAIESEPALPQTEVHTVLPELTPKEQTALQLLAQGHKNKDIAAMLRMPRGLSFSSVLKKYDVENSTQAVVLALTNGKLKASTLATGYDQTAFEKMSQQEKDILRELARFDVPNGNSDIAERVGDISSIKVNSKLNSMYKKYNLQSRQKAAAYYVLATQPEIVIQDTMAANSTHDAEQKPEIALEKYEVLILMHAMRGATYKEIKELVPEAPGIIDTHLKRIQRKFGVHTTIQAMTSAIETDTVPVEEIADEFDFSHISKLSKNKFGILYELTHLNDRDTNMALAEATGMKLEIVKDNLYEVYKKCNLRNRNQAAAYFALAEKLGHISERVAEYKEKKNPGLSEDSVNNQTDVRESESTPAKMFVIYEAAKAKRRLEHDLVR